VADDHDLETIAAGLRRDADDARLHGRVVLESLAQALPPELASVDRSGGLLRKPQVTGVRVSLGNLRYVLEATSRGLRSSVCHESGGVVMSTTEVGFDQWVRELLDALSAAATASTSAAAALQRLAISGNAGTADG
jgi:hypothetical protein